MVSRVLNHRRRTVFWWLLVQAVWVWGSNFDARSNRDFWVLRVVVVVESDVSEAVAKFIDARRRRARGCARFRASEYGFG